MRWLRLSDWLKCFHKFFNFKKASYMSASEVKRKLISKIKSSKDESLLRDMYDVIKDESRKEMLVLSNDQVQAIRDACASRE